MEWAVCFQSHASVQGFICLNNTVYTKDTSELNYLKQNNAKIFGYTLKDDLKQLRILISQNFSFQSDIFFRNIGPPEYIREISKFLTCLLLLFYLFTWLLFYFAFFFFGWSNCGLLLWFASILLFYCNVNVSGHPCIPDGIL